MPIYTPGKVTLKKDSVAATDTNIREVSLLLHGNGTNGSTTIIDSSLTPKTVTAFGNAQISTAQSKFGGASIAFDGTGDYVTVPDTQSLRMEGGDFTVEFWLRFNTISGFQTPFSKGYTSSGALLLQTGSGNGRLIVYQVGSPVITETGTGSADTWYHYALTRSGTALKLFRDGVETGSATSSFNFNDTTQLILGGGFSGPSFELNGYIDDLRITKGVARYTSNFTPPTLPFPDF